MPSRLNKTKRATSKPFQIITTELVPVPLSLDEAMAFPDWLKWQVALEVEYASL